MDTIKYVNAGRHKKYMIKVQYLFFSHTNSMSTLEYNNVKEVLKEYNTFCTCGIKI